MQRLEDANAALKRRSARPGEGLEGLPDEEEVEKYIPKVGTGWLGQQQR